jgi:hypothetical protein
MTETVVIAEPQAENTGYRFSWGLAIAGGAVATAVTFFLLALGSAFGLLLVHPLSESLRSAPAFLTGGAIYFFVAQAFGFAVGGHLAGRLLGPVVESPAQEEFRAAAHGLVAWSVAVLAALFVIGLTAAAGTATASLYGAASSKASEPVAVGYLVDQLYRPNTGGGEGQRAEASHILEAGLLRGVEMRPDDRVRLITLVSERAGVSRDQAAQRIDRMTYQVEDDARHAADTARKIAAYASFWLAASLLFGLLVSMFSAVLARHEDDRQAPQTY